MTNERKIEKVLKMNVMKGSSEGEEGPGSGNVGFFQSVENECDERVFWEES
jgi:hypothetical protein